MADRVDRRRMLIWAQCFGLLQAAGLAAATLATLLVLPSIFAIVQTRAHRRSVSLDPDDPQSSVATTAKT